MNLQEFIERYCVDIVSRIKDEYGLSINDNFLEYDDIIKAEDGTKIKVVYANTQAINVEDIISLQEEDFLKVYKTPDAMELREKYLSNYIILKGEDALNEFRSKLLREKREIDEYKSIADSIELT